ncbi:MAG TPA: amidohydrolase family protein [Acidimicrobiia bacterium]|nr:amidohydrolase family protein [Acidimicrobiia bacterium]
MRAEDLILVSVDDHVVEPPSLFDQHVSDRYRDSAPRVVQTDEGVDVWTYAGAIIPNFGLNAVAGRPPEEYGFEPTRFSEVRPGTYDVHERVRDMSANGVLGSMCFPSFPQFCGQTFMKNPDREQGLAHLRAYNDWHVDEWCGSHPDRFIPLGLVPLWDPDAIAAEVRRLAAKGCHAITFSENPAKLGLPSFHSEDWDPLWRAAVEEGTIVCLHIGSSSQMVVTAPDAPIDCMITLQPMNIVQAAADLVWSPVLRRFPEIRFALSEGGIGWIPYFLERCDYVFEHHHKWTHQDFGGLRPSDIFRRNIITCFIDDAFGIANRHEVGIDSITWECDYPHSDSTWPLSPETVAKSLEGLPDADVNRITHENAMRIFRFDPFPHRPKERCTVAALRAEAVDVDLGYRSSERLAKYRQNDEIATVAQLAYLAK